MKKNGIVEHIIRYEAPSSDSTILSPQLINANFIEQAETMEKYANSMLFHKLKKHNATVDPKASYYAEQALAGGHTAPKPRNLPAITRTKNAYQGLTYVIDYDVSNWFVTGIGCINDITAEILESELNAHALYLESTVLTPIYVPYSIDVSSNLIFVEFYCQESDDDMFSVDTELYHLMNYFSNLLWQLSYESCTSAEQVHFFVDYMYYLEEDLCSGSRGFPISNDPEYVPMGGGSTGGDPGPIVDHELDDYNCGLEVYSTFTKFDDVISSLLEETFGLSKSFHVKFVGDDLDDGLAGEFRAIDNTTIQNHTGGIAGAEFEIAINKDVLNNSTKEYIAVTYAHEAIHAVIQYYKINDPSKINELFPVFDEICGYENGEHVTMANMYVAGMVGVILQVNPNMPLVDANCLAWEGLHNTLAYEYKREEFDQINGNDGAWDQMMNTINTRERNGDPTANGTKCNN